jgi:hypothetical protein
VIRWVALKEGGSGEWGEDMRGQRPSGDHDEILGRGSIIGREGLYFLFGIFLV